MNINRINKGGYPDKQVRKSEENNPVSRGGGASTPRTEGSKQDTFTPSGPELKSDIQFARKVLSDLDRSLSELKKVKRNIADGAYDREEVQQKVGDMMQKDLDSLQAVLSGLSGSGGSGTPRELSGEYREYLIENPSVVREVADGIRRDLGSI